MDKKISELIQASSITGAEIVPIVQGSETLKTTLAEAVAGGGINILPTITDASQANIANVTNAIISRSYNFPSPQTVNITPMFEGQIFFIKNEGNFEIKLSGDNVQIKIDGKDEYFLHNKNESVTLQYFPNEDPAALTTGHFKVIATSNRLPYRSFVFKIEDNTGTGALNIIPIFDELYFNAVTKNTDGDYTLNFLRDFDITKVVFPNDEQVLGSTENLITGSISPHFNVNNSTNIDLKCWFYKNEAFTDAFSKCQNAIYEIRVYN
jgi:archaellum component FlaG (FlaF/FlaG flagellin family)